MEKLIGSRLRKEYNRTICCHPICLTYMLMRNARLDELQARIKMGGRNINNLRYADDTTPMAESKRKPKSLLMRLKESERAGLRLNIKKTKIMASTPIAAWQTEEKRWK